ncbi:MAG: glycosyltransferase [Sphingopyxis sp.]|uniref:glycosyltransferase family 2 protein n=1 Tax=Sphingopyxis sp. TaxID=1908224 RepID=UPI001A4A7E2A|nr:glycosyltransferase family 2 protein [Sphingopyxis sp.]MBL9067149.1 glycosyltransferase [Sphingopyxis sp.]
MLVLFCWVIAIPPFVALMIFSLETLLGATPLKAKSYPGAMPTTRILIPAHNEAGTIETTLARLTSIVADDVRLLVVADNCSDLTAKIVRQAGHEVIERFDSDNRGKGFALAFGIDHLRPNPPACVIIFDADCESDAASIAALAKASVAGNRVVQASYILQPDLAASPKVQISNFAFWIKNVVRQRGGHRLGSAAVLVGTGMAFPWNVIANAPLATSEIVEDLALSVHLTRSGHPPTYVQHALVKSVAATEQATLDQRTRWETGFLAIARSFGFRALWEGIATGNRKLFQLGLHLLVPPLALLLMLSLTITVAVGVGASITGQWGAFIALGLALAVAMAAVLINWMIAGRSWLGVQALLSLPLYLLWKIPVYLGIVKREEVVWKRTERASNLLEDRAE